MLNLSSLVSFLILGTIGWFTYKIYIWPFYISPLRKIPGPPSNNLLLGSFKEFIVEGGQITLKWVEQYGNITKYHGILNNPIVVVADAKIVQEIVVNQAYDFPKPKYMRASVSEVTGNSGLAVASGETHKRQRKMMNPAFTYSNIKEMVPSLIRVTSILKSLIEDKVNVGESNINLTPFISKATLDIIGLVGIGYEFNSLTSPNKLEEAYDFLLNSPLTVLRVSLRSLSNYFPFARKFLPFNEYKKYNEACKILEQTSWQLIEEKYRLDKNNELNGKDLISLLINTNKTLPVEKRLTDDELKSQVMTILVAGHSTASVSICWALHLLAKYPHEQDLLREELIKAFPDKSKFNPTFDEINSLEYLNCIVKETLRLHNPVTGITRTNNNDVTLGEYFIPKDTVILIAISALHRLTSIWGPTADNFNPKRWLDPTLNISNTDYLPFLAGPRTCIGYKLALMEIKIVLSMLIRNFTFQPIEGFHIRKGSFPVAKPEPYLGLTVSKFGA